MSRSRIFVNRILKGRALASLEIEAAMTGKRPFVVGIVRAGSGREPVFRTTTAHEAEEYATEKMKAEPTVHGAVISFERAPDGPSVLVSRVLPF